MSETMQGRRALDVRLGRMGHEPGDYGRVRMGDKWEWHVRTPNGNGGMLGQHEITEHEDGTITVTPSILAHAKPDGFDEWHGWLERGVWRSC